MIERIGMTSSALATQNLSPRETVNPEPRQVHAEYPGHSETTKPPFGGLDACAGRAQDVFVQDTDVILRTSCATSITPVLRAVRGTKVCARSSVGRGPSQESQQLTQDRLPGEWFVTGMGCPAGEIQAMSALTTWCPTWVADRPEASLLEGTLWGLKGMLLPEET